jgi:Hg(II)-responsive transcriptional regulator
MAMNGGGLRIGEVAKQAGVNVQTLRYYERRRLLEAPRRTPSGYRSYPPETVRLIRFIKRAQDLGFTLNEIKDLVGLRDAKRRKRSAVRDLAAARLMDIDRKLDQLRAMHSALRGLVASCACNDDGLQCPIIEALDDGGISARVGVQPGGSEVTSS